VAKHRNGPTDYVWLAFKNDYIRFENINESGMKREFSSKMNVSPESSDAPMRYKDDFPPDDLVPF
jgi:hypothetical protein